MEFDTSDSWDWEQMLYVGTIVLKRSDEHFWLLTPREFTALVQAHIYMNDPKRHKNVPTGFIDQVL